MKITTKLAICAAIKLANEPDDLVDSRPHVCELPEAHLGPHRCGVKVSGLGAKCGKEWSCDPSTKECR